MFVEIVVNVKIEMIGQNAAVANFKASLQVLRRTKIREIGLATMRKKLLLLEVALSLSAGSTFCSSLHVQLEVLKIIYYA
jgi:hypothetical protein